MSFLTGIYAIHAPASALNNGEGSGDIKAQVKAIRVQNREYPYVAAQAMRYWLRATMERREPDRAKSPVYRPKGGKQQAYTAGDPIQYWDDDLLGYMRAEKAEPKARRGRKSDETEETPEIAEKSDGTLTRVGAFRTGTLVASAPAEIVADFGTMARGEGHPILHGHEFYRALLVGQFSIDLSAVGTFTYVDSSGKRNLGAEGRVRAEALGLEHLPERFAYRLPFEERAGRVAALLRSFARLEGGAKQSLHLTDVSPGFVCMAVLQGGNNPFGLLVAPTALPELHAEALREVFTAYGEDFQSPLYAGLRQGLMDSSRALLAEQSFAVRHPRAAFDQVSDDLWTHPEWFA